MVRNNERLSYPRFRFEFGRFKRPRIIVQVNESSSVWFSNDWKLTVLFKAKSILLKPLFVIKIHELPEVHLGPHGI